MKLKLCTLLMFQREDSIQICMHQWWKVTEYFYSSTVLVLYLSAVNPSHDTVYN